MSAATLVCLTTSVLSLLMILAGSLFAAEGEHVPSPGTTPLANRPGIHNFFALGGSVYSGSSPENEDAFAALATLGIKTIITVDGAKPDVQTAKRYGLRYVHLPHGYDGISTNLQLQLAKAAASLSGPIYVHCHHGKHRGPAAAAILCMSRNGWTPEQAEAWLVTAGTATNYAGLYKTVREFRLPTNAQLETIPAKFPEVAQVSGLVEAMVGIDEKWEHLKSVRAVNYSTPNDHPDLQPVNEAVVLWEQYREAQHLPESARRGVDFLDRLKVAEIEVKQAESLLRLHSTQPDPGLREKLDRSFSAIGKACSACHEIYRDDTASISGQ